MPIVVTGFEPLDVLEGIRRTRAPARGRAAPRSRTPTRGPSRPRATPRPRAMLADVFEVTRPRLARHRRRSRRPGWRLSRAVPRLRRRAPVRRHRHPDRGVGLVPQRRGAAGSASSRSECAAFGTGLHPADAARRDDGESARAPARAYYRVPAVPGSTRCEAADDPVTGTADGPSTSRAGRVPLPLRDSPTIVLGHGGGGQLSAELVEHLFLPAFASGGARSDARRPATPAAAARDPRRLAARLAFSTDSYVVRPLFFPGGYIGDLAVNGTVNDLAMSGAQAALPQLRLHPGGGPAARRARRPRRDADGRRPRGRPGWPS